MEEEEDDEEEDMAVLDSDDDDEDVEEEEAGTEAAAAAAASRIAAVPFGDADAECQRLERCGQGLAAAQRALLVAEGKGPGTDLAPFKLR